MANTKDTKKAVDYKVNKLDEFKYELEITIPADIFSKTYNELLKQTSESQKVKGFREGAVPDDLMEKQIGTAVQAQAFEQLVPYYISFASQEEGLRIAMQPVVTDAPKTFILGTDIKFKAEITTIPEVKITDLSKIKLKKPDSTVTDDDIQRTLDEMFKNQQGLDKEYKEQTDEWVKSVAKVYQLENVNSLDDLKESIRKMVSVEKERIAMQQMSSDALEQAIKKSNVKIPPALIDLELDRREDELKKQLTEIQTTVEKYCETNNTSIEELRKQWTDDILKTLEVEVFIATYANKNKVTAEEEEVKKEIEHIKLHNKDADPKVFTDPRWIDQVRAQIVKQKAYEKFLDEVLPEEMKPKNQEPEHTHEHKH
jgi:FKBP-type peptidyl-prolyl cis-trans isomerase (trigger factor)